MALCDVIKVPFRVGTGNKCRGGGKRTSTLKGTRNRLLDPGRCIQFMFSPTFLWKTGFETGYTAFYFALANTHQWFCQKEISDFYFCDADGALTCIPDGFCGYPYHVDKQGGEVCADWRHFDGRPSHRFPSHASSCRRWRRRNPLRLWDWARRRHYQQVKRGWLQYKRSMRISW